MLAGVFNGFTIVDNVHIESYDCHNYPNILNGQFCKDMTDTITRELKEGKVTLAGSPLKCIHSLGAVAKKDGTLRPITDCKTPLK